MITLLFIFSYILRHALFCIDNTPFIPICRGGSISQPSVRLIFKDDVEPMGNLFESGVDGIWLLFYGYKTNIGTLDVTVEVFWKLFINSVFIGQF